MYIGKTDSVSHSDAKLLFRAVLVLSPQSPQTVSSECLHRGIGRRRFGVAFHIRSLQKMTYVTAVPGLCWKLAASPHPATHTFCSGQNKHFGRAGEGRYARRGETAGGPRSSCPQPTPPPSRPGPTDGAAPREPCGKEPGPERARRAPGRWGGVLPAAGAGLAQPRGAAAEGRAERCRAGPAAPPGAGKGQRLQPGGGSGGREPRGGRDLAGAAEGAGAGAGAGAAHGEVSPPRRTVFCGRNSLEPRQ